MEDRFEETRRHATCVLDPIWTNSATKAIVARPPQYWPLPPMESIPKDLDFAGACIPAWQVGGDFYDVYADKDGRIGLMLTDVAGKGLPAALLSSLIQGALRATSWTSDALMQEESRPATE